MFCSVIWLLLLDTSASSSSHGTFSKRHFPSQRQRLQKLQERMLSDDLLAAVAAEKEAELQQQQQQQQQSLPVEKGKHTTFDDDDFVDDIDSICEESRKEG